MSKENKMKVLKVDNREPKVIQNALGEFFTIELSNLDLGDYIFQSDNEIIIIERKSINDLLSSVKDSRYSEQSERLLNSNCKIYYIIEGNIPKNDSIERKIIYSCIFSLSYKKNFHVILLNNQQDTINYLKEFYKRFYEYSDSSNNSNSSNLSNSSNSSNSSNLSNLSNITKKNTVNKNNINIIMLSQIPGVSYKTAEQILQDKTLFDFIYELQQSNNYEILDTIKINNRKLGKNIKQNIIDYLLAQNVFNPCAASALPPHTVAT